jgi:hypothetical protein
VPESGSPFASLAPTPSPMSDANREEVYAATQQFITDQVQMAWEAAAVAQSQAAMATYSAYILNLARSEPSVVNWIAGAEQKLLADGCIRP